MRSARLSPQATLAVNDILENTKSDHRQYPRNATTGFLCLKYHHGNTAETSVFHQLLSHPFIHNYDFAIANLFRSKRLRTKSAKPHNPGACCFASSLICLNVSFCGGRCQKCLQLHRPPTTCLRSIGSFIKIEAQLLALTYFKEVCVKLNLRQTLKENEAEGARPLMW